VRAAVLALLTLTLTASPAAASEVLVAEPGGGRAVEDPYLPPDDAGPAPVGDCDAPAAVPAGARPTVSGTVDRAVAAGEITPDQGEGYKATYRHARTVAAGLPASRKRELRGAISVLEGLVLRRALPAARMPAAFLQLGRNAEWWSENDPPSAPQPAQRPCAGGAGLGGARVTFPGDPVIFQWYPGQGLAIQPLATFGRANALWAACGPKPTPGLACKPDELRLLLDRMVAVAGRRGNGFLAWEYLFSFGGGRAPWISGIAQGTGIQAFTRGAQLLGNPAYLEVARQALGAFEAPPPTGVRVPADGGAHYLLYSFAPRLRVLNAFLQALVGIYDFAHATGDPRATALFNAGDRAARRALPRFDTGAWSLYAQGGAESDLGYHRLVRDFLGSLCARTATPAYCARRTRFDRYLHERTRVAVRLAGRRRAGRTLAVRITLSKISCVTVRLRRGDAVVATRTLVLPRGTRNVAVLLARAGRHSVEVQARDLMDHRTTVTRSLAVSGNA
jgi:hypothetical protein